VTEIRPAGEFFRAEGYHQKYRLRLERELLREFTAIYPLERDFVDSTAVARVNGYLDGYGTLADLQAELPGLGLSPKAGERLAAIVSKRPGRTGCRI
jgi:peptide-methionine (S)-S-oxide reductase